MEKEEWPVFMFFGGTGPKRKRRKRVIARRVFCFLGAGHPIVPCVCLLGIILLCVVFTLNRSFYSTSVHPVSVLILHPREIQILWSNCETEKPKQPQLIKVRQVNC